jgi:hypothetical protein
LFVGFVFSTFGYALFRWGKKRGRMPQLVAGILLMVAPYLCPSLVLMIVVCGGIGATLYLATRLGM